MRHKWLMAAALMLLLVSCGWEEKYEREREQVLPDAVQECTNHNQKTLSVYYEDGWKVICYQESPFKTITKEVG